MCIICTHWIAELPEIAAGFRSTLWEDSIFMPFDVIFFGDMSLSIQAEPLTMRNTIPFAYLKKYFRDSLKFL